MALRNFADMKHDDDDRYDLAKGMPPGYEPPEYPGGLQIGLISGDLEKVGGTDGATPGASMRFSAMGEATSVFKGMTDTRVEVEITEFAGENGQFFELETPAHICLCESDQRKMDLDDDCERGDTIHLIGTARLESTSSSEFGGDRAVLQITELTFIEDESAESREG